MTTATIYQIRHTASGRCYVGHTCNPVDRRWYDHRRLLAKGVHHSPYLQHVWDKHGAGAFAFEVVEICPAAVKLDREQHYIDAYNSVFNYARVAGSRLGVPQSEATRQKVSASLVGNLRSAGRVQTEAEKRKRADAHRGQKRSAETRAKMSAAMKGNTNGAGHVVSAEARAKIKAATDATRPTMRGKKHRPETIEKIRQSNIATKARKKLLMSQRLPA